MGFISGDDFIAAAGVIIAAIGLAAALVKFRPVRWVWRRLVTEPVTAWYRREHAAAIEPLRAELLTTVQQSRDESTRQHNELRAHVDRRYDNLVRRIDTLEDYVTSPRKEPA